MTAKDVFLKRIDEQIKSLQEAYEFNKNLPDSLFENLHPISKPVDLPSANVSKSMSNLKAAAEYFTNVISNKVQEPQNEYGMNRRLVLQILIDEKMPMVKWNIVDRFAKRTSKTADEVLNTVTNTLAGLNTDKAIKGYKPEGLKFKGLFWGLKTWFDGDKIKPEFSPFRDGKLIEL